MTLDDQQHPTPRPDSPADALALLAASDAAERAAARVKFETAADWAAMHPAESVAAAAHLDYPGALGRERAVPIAGPGAPLVAEFCLAEFATALGLSTDAARSYLGDAVEVHYRLPRLWQQVVVGAVPVWRARRIAALTATLTEQAARFVDGQVWHAAGSLGPAALDRLIATAIALHDPQAAQQQRDEALAGRRFDVHTGRVSPTGPGAGATVEVDGLLDLADALDLEAAVAVEAEALKHAGSTEPLSVRRAQALAVLARRQLTLTLNPDLDSDSRRTNDRPGVQRRVSPRSVVIHAHLSSAALAGAGVDTPDAADVAVGHVEGRGIPRVVVTADQVRAWCATPDTQVVVRPVLHLDEHSAAGGYAPTAAQAERVRLTCRTCVFPYCQRPAHACDCDHVSAHAAGGPTCDCNLALLCRLHHRLKTHTGWTYDVLAPGDYAWTSPHGQQFHRHRDGTTTRPERPPRRPPRQPAHPTAA